MEAICYQLTDIDKGLISHKTHAKTEISLPYVEHLDKHIHLY